MNTAVEGMPELWKTAWEYVPADQEEPAAVCEVACVRHAARALDADEKVFCGAEG